MKCLQCNVEMKQISLGREIKVYGEWFCNNTKQQRGHLDLFVCPQCGLSQFYITNKEALHNLTNSED